MKLTSLLTMAAAMLISANSYAANSETYKYGDESPINQNDKKYAWSFSGLSISKEQ